MIDDEMVAVLSSEDAQNGGRHEPGAAGLQKLGIAKDQRASLEGFRGLTTSP